MSVTDRALGSKYELVAPIGTGAMGVVWRARDRVTGEAVAAKVLRSEFSANREIVGRFVQERSILTALSHPGIVRVRDLVVEGDDLAIVMDLVEGEDLRAALTDARTLPPALAAGIVAEILDALATAHQQGTLHRDVKPDNVLLTPEWRTLKSGSVRLSDFSIARLAQDSTVQATGLLGTPEYMPPELFSDGMTSAASDVYAAGVVLYELLAGRSPFAGPGNAWTIGNRAVTMQPPTLPVPGPLWQLLTALLAKDPRQRPRASGAAAELRRIAQSLGDAPALPEQPVPDSWTPSGGQELGTGPIHVSATDGALDVGSTNLDVVFAPEESRAVGTGEVAAIAPVTDLGDLEAGVTNVAGLSTPAYRAPVLEPTIERPEAKKGSKRKTWLLSLLGAAVVVALIVGGMTLFGGGGSKKEDGPAGPTDASTSIDDPQVTGTGLEVTRTAAYDAEKKEVTLTLTFAADKVPLNGPFLEVIPKAEGAQDCPLPAWSGAEVVENNPLQTGITTPCGFRLTTPTLTPGSPQEVTAVLPLELEGDAQDALANWLQATGDATADALAKASPTNTAFAAQRLESVDVSAPVTATNGQGEIQIVLYPIWAGAGEPDKLHPLFDSTAGTTTNLLDQIAGGLDKLRLFDDCNGAVVVKNRSVTVLRASDACTIVANVGNLADLRSNVFQISGNLS